MRLPLPLPDDHDLAVFVEARYAAMPDERLEIEPPFLPKTRDGVLTALHYFFQNNPVVFLGGCAVTAAALLDIAFRMLRAVFG